MTNVLIASMVLAVWLYLLLGRGLFWLGRERDEATAPGQGPSRPEISPSVIAVIPARDEAECVGDTVASLLRQDYPGTFQVIVVDDQSRDGTAQVARDAAATLGAGERLTVIAGRALPPGWTGKLWAQSQGVEAAEAAVEPPEFILFTDADIVYVPDELRKLVARARSGGTVLTSLMAKLRCESFAERMFVPAFIFFFQMLYPFAWANDPRREHRGGGRRLHAGAARSFARGRRDGVYPQRPDRRLRARQAAQGARADLDRPDRWREERPRLSGGRRHPQDGVAHRLCAAAIFAADPGRDGRSAWPSPICFPFC